MTAMRLMAKLRFLRGTSSIRSATATSASSSGACSPSSRPTSTTVLSRLDAANHAAAVRLLGVPETIKGYGRVKDASAAEAEKARAAALKQFHAQKAPMEMAA